MHRDTLVVMKQFQSGRQCDADDIAVVVSSVLECLHVSEHYLNSLSLTKTVFYNC